MTYDNIGNKVTLDVYMSKTAADTWDARVYDMPTSTAGGFPYATPALGCRYVHLRRQRRPARARWTPPARPVSPCTVPGGSPLTIDLSNMTQVATDFSFKATVNGNAPSAIDKVEVDDDGTIVRRSSRTGTRLATYTIPLADGRRAPTI